MIEIITKSKYNPLEINPSDLWNLLNTQRELEISLGELGITMKVENRDTSKIVVDIDYILQVVSEYFGIPVDIILSKTRKREICQSRQICMYFSRNLISMPLQKIGDQIGGKGHDTVINACKIVNNLIETDKRFKLQIDEIGKRLK